MTRKCTFLKSPAVSVYVKKLNPKIVVTPGFLYMLDEHVKFLIEKAVAQKPSFHRLDMATADSSGINSTEYFRP